MNRSSTPLFRTKICGLTRAADLLACVDAQADAVGLNFYPRSRRFLGDEQVPELQATLRELGPQRPAVVGVFVNAAPSEIQQRVDQFQLDWIQLHGQEPPDFSRQLPVLPVLRAMAYGSDGLAHVAAEYEVMQAMGCAPAALLLDAMEAGQFGGTGRVLPWSRLQSELASGRTLPAPWVLAGGLTAENVGEAIRALSPPAVDVASGVESEPGRKDPERIRQFVTAAREAWSAIG